MKTLPRFDETEITVADGIITIKQTTRLYDTSSIQIPVAMWGTLCDLVSEEIYPDEFFDNPEPIEP